MTRGTSQQPPNPFLALHVEADDEAKQALWEADPEGSWAPILPRTKFYQDDTQTLITANDSEDLSFEASINPYRGCEHGCSYCYARRYHEYLGWSAGLDFEAKILVKPRAPALLRAELENPRWTPKKLSLSGVTDCYQPVERRLEITRGCLAVLAEFRNPVVVITKNHLVTRDIDHLSELSRWQAGAVLISLTTLDRDLARILEPRASGPQSRLLAIRQLHTAGIPVGVSIAPLIPGLTDHELPTLMEAAREAGASFATYSIVRLPGSVAQVFEGWLAQHVSAQKAENILKRIRESHQGHLNDNRPLLRMKGDSPRDLQLKQLFTLLSKKLKFDGVRPPLSTSAFRRVQAGQLELEL